jgi:hypothetical protein
MIDLELPLFALDQVRIDVIWLLESMVYDSKRPNDHFKVAGLILLIRVAAGCATRRLNRRRSFKHRAGSTVQQKIIEGFSESNDEQGERRVIKGNDSSNEWTEMYYFKHRSCKTDQIRS